MIKYILTEGNFNYRKLDTKIKRGKIDTKSLTPIQNRCQVKSIKYSKLNDINIGSNNKKIYKKNYSRNVITSNLNNGSLTGTGIMKTTMDSNISKQKKKALENKDSLSFIKNKTMIVFYPEINNKFASKFVTQNIKRNKSKKPKIKIKKSTEKIFTKIRFNKNKNNSNNIFILNKKSNNVKEKRDIKLNSKSFIIPKRIDVLKNLEKNYLIPIKIRNKINRKNSKILKKKVNNMEKSINSINIKQEEINRSKTFVIKSKLKNIYDLLEKKKESNYYKEKIKKEKAEIKNIKDKLRIINNQCNMMKNERVIIESEINAKKEEVKELQIKIGDILNNKKNAINMIVNLHKRIIDIKKRLKLLNEKTLYLDKSFYELEIKYKL
jgi:hypothetical protein